MDLGSFIKKLRTDNNLSIREVSRLSGVSHPYISQIETGKNDNPSPEILNKLAGPLGVTQFDLMSAAGYFSLTESDLQRKKEMEDFYDNLTPEQLGEYVESQAYAHRLENFRRENYPDIEEILKDGVRLFFDKKELKGKDRSLVYRVLKAIFEDKEKNYPTDDEIEEEFAKIERMKRNLEYILNNEDFKQEE